MSYVLVNGVYVATTQLTRDGETEALQLMLLADAVTGNTQSVEAPGISGSYAAAVQGVTDGVAMPVSGTVAVSNLNPSDASSSAVAIEANSGSATTIKSSAGKLCQVVVTSVGSGPLSFYNNASGTDSGMVLGTIPADVEVGEIYPFLMPASEGISCPVQANNPGVSVSYQ